MKTESLADWLRMVDAIDSYPTREERCAHAERVRAAIGSHVDRSVRWNVSVCDRLDVAIASAPRVT